MKNGLLFAIGCSALSLFVAAQAWGQIKAPVIGVARLADGSVRTVYGLPDDLIFDSKSLGSFDAASFSDKAGLVSENGRIDLVRTDLSVIAGYSTGETKPLLNVDGDATSAIAWLPSSRSLLHWNGNSFVLTSVTGLDETLSIDSVRVKSANTAELLVSDARGVVLSASVSLQSGNLLSLAVIPGAHGRAFWQQSIVLLADESGLHVLSPSGMVETTPIGGGPMTFEHISSNWLLIRSADRRTWALQTLGNKVHVSEAPEVTQ